MCVCSAVVQTQSLVGLNNNKSLIKARADDNGISLLLYFVFYLFILQCEYSFDTFVSASLPAVTESTASPDEMGESF